jgi:hypothetical protein
VERFDGVKFYQAIHLTPAKSKVLARLNDQTPLVLERQFGEGKVLAFASTFDNISNDLPLHASWVSFIQNAATYLGGGGADQQANLPVDSYVELRTSDSQGAAAEVLDAEGHRLLSLDEASKARNFALSHEGFFEVRTAGGRRTLVAAHADRKESDLAVISKETLDLWAATGESAQGTVAGAAGSAGEGLTKPWSFSPAILLLLLGVVLAESVIANRYLQAPAYLPPGAKKETA